MRLAGVDGRPAGWLCVVKDWDRGSIMAVVYRGSDDLLQVIKQCELVAMDIPIGWSDG